MIRLRPSIGHNHIGVFTQRVCHQKFQLAGFVSATGQSGAVIALYKEFSEAEFFRKIRGFLDRGRKRRERYTRYGIEFHSFSLV